MALFASSVFGVGLPLLGLLPLFGGLCGGTGGFGLGLLLSGVALRIGLVLLRLTFAV